MATMTSSELRGFIRLLRQEAADRSRYAGRYVQNRFEDSITSLETILAHTERAEYWESFGWPHEPADVVYAHEKAFRGDDDAETAQRRRLAES